ncbi:MAG: hypothetical protein C4332_09190 [Meiothermus sp.]
MVGLIGELGVGEAVARDLNPRKALGPDRLPRGGGGPLFAASRFGLFLCFRDSAPGLRAALGSGFIASFALRCLSFV